MKKHTKKTPNRCTKKIKKNKNIIQKNKKKIYWPITTQTTISTHF